MNKEQILDTLKKYNLDSSKYIILSGASLTLRGIKDKTCDIDIAVTPDYYDYLVNNYDCTLDCIDKNNNKVYYIDNVINFGLLYYSKNYDDMYGFRLQTLNEIIDLKKLLNREKDTKDLELIYKYIGNKNSLALAYLGDSIYEFYIRRYLIDKGIVKVNELQKESIKYVSAKGQSNYLKKLIENNILTSDELSVVVSARNHKCNHKPKNCDIVTYKYATGFEALIGYLYYCNNIDRIEELINIIIKKVTN